MSMIFWKNNSRKKNHRKLFDRKKNISKKSRKNWSSKNFQQIFFRSEIFSIKILVDQKCSSKIFSTVCFDFFSIKNVRPIFFGSPISIPNFPKIPKITLRTLCDRSKNTNSTHEEKVCPPPQY